MYWRGKRALVWRRMCFSRLRWCAVQLWRLKFIQTVYKRWVCTSQRTNSVSSARLINESCSESSWVVTGKNKSCNKSQQDAPFLNFILVKNSTCFGQTHCPSSGVLILYSQQLIFVILVMLMFVSEVGMELVGFYYKNISRCTVIWMSDW
jgi:hypothetical protein